MLHGADIENNVSLYDLMVYASPKTCKDGKANYS